MEDWVRAGARRVAVVATVHADDSVLVAAIRQGGTVYATVNVRHELRARHHLRAHVGTIYQASNSLYLGRGRARTLKLLPDGTVLNDRSVAKVAAQHRGHEYVERQLVAFGARSPEAGEDPRAWLAEALATVGVRRLPHGGNHRYAFALGSPAERRSIRADLRRRAMLPYPKRVDRAA